MTIQVWAAAPLVVLATVHPGSNPGLGARLVETHPGGSFITIIAADTADFDLGSLLEAVHPATAELIFSDVGVEEAPSADTLSWRALGECGVGQDFVFQVPGIEAAVGYGLAQLTGTTARWEGTALLVVGSAGVVGAARTALERAPR